MADIWGKVHALRGSTLLTISYRKAFDITDVQSDRVCFVPQQGNGTVRWASREQIERVAELAIAGKPVNPKLVRGLYPDDQNTSYIAAIVQEIMSAR